MDAFFPPVTVRPLDSEAERRNGFACFRQAMLALPDLGSIEPDMETAYLAHDRMLGAFDGATLLGVTNGYDSAITVPGGAQIRHLSVTHVGVTATATRRGIARQLLTQQLRQARDTGYAVAGLRASNAGLYGRYGYGVASWSVRQELDLAQAHPAIALPRTGVRPVDPSTAFPLLRRIAAAHPPTRAAGLVRWDAWWAMQAFRARHGSPPFHAAVFGAEDDERGFLRFHVAPNDNWLMSASRSIIVDDLYAADDEAWRALIGYLFSLDIVQRVIFNSRPVDDPLPLLLRDQRVLETSLRRDESWIRPLDVATLLTARTYGDANAIVLAIEDELFPENNGPWRISPQGVARVVAAPQARIAVADLASLAFGAHGAHELAAAQRLHTTAPDTLDQLARLFHTPRSPHAGLMF